MVTNISKEHIIFILQMEAIYSYKMLVTTYKTTHHHYSTTNTAPIKNGGGGAVNHSKLDGSLLERKTIIAKLMNTNTVQFLILKYI
jgi:hypothetical protein